MIRMIQSRSSAHAKSYFSEALAKSDYYVSDQELAGRWHGQLAQRLGLEGLTDKETFFALCDNRNPLTQAPLTPRKKDNRTTGYDINFHCPKSVSIMHALGGSDDILKAFEASVTETMRVIEHDSKTRVRLAGLQADRTTGELVWAQFTHQTARPVEGNLPDPHLHAHNFTFNATWDEKEGRFKATQFREINRNMPYYQARFHKALADKLADLGYGIRRTEKSFEIEGVPQAAIDLFSKRTDAIGRIAKEKGITDAKELGELGARTRAKKQKGASMAELKSDWLKQVGIIDLEHIRKETQADREQQISARQCLDYALLHCFERASVVSEQKILQTALTYGIGISSVSVDDITRLFKADKRIIHIEEKGQMLCTTKEVLAEEKRMVDLARQGFDKHMPLYATAPDLRLDGQQAEAIKHVLTTPHMVSIVRGAAGTGKTALMQEAKEKITEAGKSMIVVAPTAQASRGVLKSEGFEDAETVAKLLIDKELQESIRNQVLWVDEAGLLGTKDMTALLELATKQNAKLILGGDTRQHASVVRGDALRIINTVGGVKSAELNKIRRQQNEAYRSAVEDLAKGDVPTAFEKLDDMGVIQTIEPEEATQTLANDFVQLQKRGKSALVISPTHAQGEAVTQEIRTHLKEHGLLGKKEIVALQYKNQNLTEAEKTDWRNYDEGMTVQFSQNAKGFKRGEIVTVKTAGEKEIIVFNAKGVDKALPLNRPKRFDVLDKQEMSLSKSDRVRITRNGFDREGKRMDNGDMMIVLSANKDGMKLQNENSKSIYSVSNDFGHLAHSYCITSYASQGKSVDEVLIYQPSATFGATDARQFYVSVSRGKEGLRIYTDNKEQLLDYASELGERQSALELINRFEAHKDFVEQFQRSSAASEKQIFFDKTKIKSREDYEP